MKNFNKLERLYLTISTTLLFNSIAASILFADEVKLDLLCPKFPLNSRCQDYQYDLNPSQPDASKYLLNRNDFCEDFFFNSLCQQEQKETIDFNLIEEEWIRIIKSGNLLHFVFADRMENPFFSLFTDEAVSLIPLPDLFYLLPLSLLDILPLDLTQYHWHDYEITQVIFQSDRCTSECYITGKNSLNLPDHTHFSQGLFTVKYRQQDLQRSVTFRLPQNIKVVPIETIAIEVPNGMGSQN